MTVEVRVAVSADAELFAGIHAGCFDDHWSAASFRSLLDSPGVFGLAAGRDVWAQAGAVQSVLQRMKRRY